MRNYLQNSICLSDAKPSKSFVILQKFAFVQRVGVQRAETLGRRSIDLWQKAKLPKL